MSNLALYMRFSLALASLALLGYAVVVGDDGDGNYSLALVALTTAAWQWFFGSSKGSSDKIEKMFPDA